GGPGPEGTAGMMTALGLRPARRNALAAGVTETAGGAAIALGLATPLASAALIGTMVTAIRKVHLANGPWAANGGWEYNAVLIATLVALADDGPGDASLDAAMGLERRGAAWGLGALVLGAAASTLVIELGARAPMEAADAAAALQAPETDTAGDPTTEE
ncbi:MAG TPA: DoxX family protein, partial [Actinomycetales bacterium]